MKRFHFSILSLALCFILLITVIYIRNYHTSSSTAENSPLFSSSSSSSTTSSSELTGISSATSGEDNSVFLPPEITISPQVELSAEQQLSLLVSCNAITKSWGSTDEISPDSIVSFYTALGQLDDRLPDIDATYPKHPTLDHILMYAKYIEKVGELYFGVSPDMLHKSSYYYEPENCYMLFGLGSVVSCTVKEVVSTNEQTAIHFEMFRDGVYEAIGTLIIQNNTNGDWKYKSLVLKK